MEFQPLNGINPATILYFVIRCEAKIFKVKPNIFYCTQVKCFLQTNLASSMKPRSISSQTSQISPNNFQNTPHHRLLKWAEINFGLLEKPKILSCGKTGFRCMLPCLIKLNVQMSWWAMQLQSNTILGQKTFDFELN